MNPPERWHFNSKALKENAKVIKMKIEMSGKNCIQNIQYKSYKRENKLKEKNCLANDNN